jgi:thiol:disulfide interchange protein DsbD
MLTFKHIMGFVLLLTVLYLMVSLRQDLLLFTVAFLVFVALGAWIHGRFALEASTPRARWTVLGAAVLAIGLGAWLSFGAFPRLFEESPGDGIAWTPFDAEVLEELHSSGTTVMVDWTADWCPNCKFVERFVLDSKEVRTLLDELGVVALKADITRSGEATQVMQALQKVLGSRSIPFLAVFPGGDPYRPYVLRDLYTIGDLREILLEIRDAPAR